MWNDTANRSSVNSDALFGPVYKGDERSFDFTLLFEDTILTIVPASLFLVAGSARAIWLTRTPNKVGTSFSRIAKMALLSSFATVQMTLLLTRAGGLNIGTKASVSAASLDFAAALVLLLLSSLEHSRSVTPSTIIGVYLLISLLFDAVRLRTFCLLGGPAVRGIVSLLSFSVAVKAAVLVIEAVEKRNILLGHYRDLPPEATSGIYNRSVFWWLNPLLKVGFGKSLDVDDLYNLDDSLLSINVQYRFRNAWKSSKDHGRFTLLLMTVRVLKWQLLLASIPRLCLSAVRYAQPFLIQRTITYISERENQSSAVGWGLAAAYFLVYFLQAILRTAYLHILNRFATQVRGGLISLLYNKTLDLSITATDTSASLTLMSADVQRIMEVTELIHDTWASVLDVALAMFLLYLNMGKVCYAPAVVYVLQMTGTGWVTGVISQFQKRWLNAAQVRVSFTSSLLHSMRNVKLLGMSSVIKDRTQGLRINEINECKRYRTINNLQILCRNSSSLFSPFATFFAYYLQARRTGQELSLSTAFSVLTILRLVDQPLNVLLFACPMIASSISCFDRIQTYLLSRSRHDNRLSLHDVYDSSEYWGNVESGGEAMLMRRLGSISRSPASEALTLKSCSFGWTIDGEAIVRDVDLSLPSGSTTMIIGPVGCGKSTLLKGILSETPLSRGFVYLQNHSIAFADQEAWVQNGTIRDAICGFDSQLSSRIDEGYQEVLFCCGLVEDLKMFPKGDMTTVGSKGISLSGGQKQRLALARAVYSKAELLILDDVFSGLDNDTEELIFKRLFSRNGPLKRRKTTIVMVTHAVHRLPYADLIVSLDERGCVSEQGNYLALINSNGYVQSLDVRFKENQQNLDKQDAEYAVGNEAKEPSSSAVTAANDDNEEARDLIRRTGEWKTYQQWFRASGYLASGLTVLWGFSWVITTQIPGLLLQAFSNNDDSSSGPSLSQPVMFVSILGGTAVAGAVAVLLLGWQIFLDMQPRSSSNLHLHLLETVLNAPLSFFTRTDIGAITNRFSQDMALVDSNLPFAYADVVLSATSAISGMFIMAASGAGYFTVTIPVVIVALYSIQKYYLRTSRQMRLLDLEQKAPLYTMFGETSAGLATVRAFGWTQKFAERNLELLDRSQRPFYFMFCIQRWLGIVLDLLVTVLVTLLMVIVVAKRQSINPGLVGLGLLSAVTLGSSLTEVVRSWTELETSIGAISRLRDFVRSTECEHKPTETQIVDRDWPGKGEVNFSSFEASYSLDSDLVLRNVNLKVNPGEKVGICGRSGSGKSSMLASLFHLLEFRGGQTQIDGVDIAHVSRETLRAKLNVIPQEPWWVTTESVRFNMDPWNSLNSEFDHPLERRGEDDNFISVLSECQIWHVIQKKGGLNAIMTADFLSHGQRQLFCLARAMVRRSKVVILDEVSANVDVKTDELMQRIIRQHFDNCTVITVAHRLNTILDHDRVVVLNQGKVVEVGEPMKLLNVEGSRFKDLYEA